MAELDAQTIAAQNTAAEQMKARIQGLQGRVQPELNDSMNMAVRALDHYQTQLQQLSQVDPADPRSAQVHAEAYAQMERAMQVLDRSQEEITTLLGPSPIMQQARVNFRSAHEGMSPQAGIAQAPGTSMTIQEKLYGVRIEHDADGRPLLPEIGTDAEEVRVRGLGQDLDLAEDREHSISMGDDR
jgi:hypothetical protein